MKLKPANQYTHGRKKIAGLWVKRISSVVFACAIFFSTNAGAFQSGRYTEKQLDALEDRVGKNYWLNPRESKTPAFLSAPAPGSTTFNPRSDESFEIIELAGRANQDPYYKVKFESGKIGYIRPERFHEEFNATILTSDPLAEERRKAEEQSAEDKKRVAWINAQPWSAAVKDAAIKKQPPPGLTTAEIKQVMGTPRRIAKVRGPQKIAEEHWIYPDGSILIFNNGLLNRIEKTQTK